MFLGSVCVYCLEISPTALRKSVVVGLQTLKTFSQLQTQIFWHRGFQLCHVEFGWTVGKVDCLNT